MTVDLSTLRSGAAAAADELHAAFPDVEFTSGKRDLPGQAHAMASNVVSNRKWIAQTYVQSTASVASQLWVDVNPAALTVDVIAAGLLSVLQTLTPEELHALSWHLSGDAFDVAPVAGERGQTICAKLAELVANHVAAGGQAKLLLKEGGLMRWHCQFSPLPLQPLACDDNDQTPTAPGGTP